MEFIGRKRQLADLAREFERSAPSLAIVYGRRRIGKSALLQKAARDHGAFVYFQATKVEEAVNVEAFKRAISDALGPDPILQGLFGWEPVLHWLANKAAETPKLIVILDEFSYLTGGTDVLPSVIQRFVDSGAMSRGSMKLVLCGSIVSQMEALLAERNALYGRRTMAFELKELPLRDAAQFLPQYGAMDIVEAYATFGGIPYHLQALDPGADLRANIVDLLLSPTGALYNEPELLMQTELRETSRYSSIVAAIASGATKLGEIIARSGLTNASQASPYLETLARMRIAAGRRSFGGGPKDKDVRYVVSDPLFRFWYRFVQPNVSAIESGFGQDVFERQVRPSWPTYMGDRFEEICREHVRRHGQERLPAPLAEVGKAWSADHDLDVVGRLLDDSFVAGECKWEGRPMGPSILRALRDNAARMPVDWRPLRYALFAKMGYAPELLSEAERDPDVILYELEELVREPEPEPTYIPSP